MISEGYPLGIILIHAVVGIFQNDHQWNHHTNIALSNRVKGMIITDIDQEITCNEDPNFAQIKKNDQTLKITPKWPPKNAK